MPFMLCSALCVSYKTPSVQISSASSIITYHQYYCAKYYAIDCLLSVLIEIRYTY